MLHKLALLCLLTLLPVLRARASTATTETGTQLTVTSNSITNTLAAGVPIPNSVSVSENGGSATTAETNVSFLQQGGDVQLTVVDRVLTVTGAWAPASTGQHEVLLQLQVSSGPAVRGTLFIDYGVTHYGGMVPEAEVSIDGASAWTYGGGLIGSSAQIPLTINQSVEIRTRTGIPQALLPIGAIQGTLQVRFERDQKQLVLPPNHHLTQIQNQANPFGAHLFFRGSSGSRFQILYQGSHFVDNGAAGPIDIERISFRGEDGMPNLGGQYWSDATVQVSATSRTSLSQTFATNLDPSTTTAGQAVSLADLVMLPSDGSVPNNDNVVFDLDDLGVGITLDPTGARPNLLVDVTLPSGGAAAPPSGPPMVMQNAAGPASLVRGSAIVGGSLAATGLQVAPLVMGVGFQGAGGYYDPVPSRNEYIGASCGGSPSAFYQTFLPGQEFDLRETSLRLVPDQYPNPNFYTVQTNTNSLNLNQLNAVPDLVADDGVVAHTMPFAFDYPGGSTSEIHVSTNGLVFFEPPPAGEHDQPSVAAFLGDGSGFPAVVAPFWHDLHAGRNLATQPNSGVHVRSTGIAPFRFTWITWYDVGVPGAVFGGGIGGHAVYRFQLVLQETTGNIEFRYGPMQEFVGFPNGENDLRAKALVGFSRGNINGTPSVDPQTRDLSIEIPFSTAVEGSQGNIGFVATSSPNFGNPAYGGRWYQGQSMRWNTSNIPPGTILGVLLIDFASSRPGLNIPGIHAPGCLESTTLNPLITEVYVLPGSNISGVVPWTSPSGYVTGLVGAKLYAQFAVLDGLFNPGPLVTSLSNGIEHTFGLR